MAACSIVTWFIALERIWTIRKITRYSRELQENISTHLQNKKKDLVLEACLKSQVPLARVIEELIKSNVGAEQMSQKASRRRQELNFEYKKSIWILATIGSATPFLGLFGTVVGILRAFKNIAITGDAGFSVVAGEISEALIATASGIIVAVIAIAFFNYLQVLIGRLVAESRLTIDEFLELWN